MPSSSLGATAKCRGILSMYLILVGRYTFAPAITCRCHNSDSSVFKSLVARQGSSMPSALGWGCIIEFLCAEVSSFHFLGSIHQGPEKFHQKILIRQSKLNRVVPACILALRRRIRNVRPTSAAE